MTIHYDMENYAEYLRDESRLTGVADSISFPCAENEVVRLWRELAGKKIPVTIQGARTGISGGAVPAGGHILNLSRLNRIKGMRHRGNDYYLTVEPGVILADLRESIAACEFRADEWDAASREALAAFKTDTPRFFSPDPTEPSASVGGMAAADASGARGFYYGSIRKHITALKVLLPTGGILNLRRGELFAAGYDFKLTPVGKPEISGNLPRLGMTHVKNTAGYYIEENMDLIDLFIGSEGTLGIILELEIRLLSLPPERWGVLAFFEKENQALDFVCRLRDAGATASGAHLAALEFFNTGSLELLGREKAANPSFAALPVLPLGKKTALYCEYHAGSQQAAEEAVEVMSELLVDCGGDLDVTWMATQKEEMKPLTFFRHAVPELVNLEVDRIRKNHPGVTKLGTDMAVPDDALVAVLTMYNNDLAQSGLESVIFGHIGDNHLHVNIIPSSDAEYAKGLKLYKKWAREIVRLGGSVSAEHGIGKLKVALLELMYGKAGCAELARLKVLLDPDNLLGKGNLFPDESKSASGEGGFHGQ